MPNYANPYPVYARHYSSPYIYPGSNEYLAIRWGRSRGVMPNAVVILSITPETGPAAGGTAVVIRGTGFHFNATVTIGGVPATSVVVVNSQTITAITGAHAPGVVDVIVTNPNGDTFTLVGGFTYT